MHGFIRYPTLPKGHLKCFLENFFLTYQSHPIKLLGFQFNIILTLRQFYLGSLPCRFFDALLLLPHHFLHLMISERISDLSILQLKKLLMFSLHLAVPLEEWLFHLNSYEVLKLPKTLRPLILLYPFRNVFRREFQLILW